MCATVGGGNDADFVLQLLLCISTSFKHRREYCFARLVCSRRLNAKALMFIT